jgi:glycine betaine/choline ABC-type transport system substrate-binding protein
MVRTALLPVILTLAAGCSPGPRITVGSKNFTEQVLLGEILARQVERRTGIAVERRLNLGGTLLAHEGLRTGAIDLYPEYTGTALAAVLKRPVSRDAAAVLAAVREGYHQWKISWLEPLGFDNTFAMVVRSDAARAGRLRTLTGAAGRPEPWLLGVGYEFLQRPDGLAGLVRTYNLRVAGSPVTMDLGLLYAALESGKVQMAAASATDGQLTRPEFTVLLDDRHYFPPYQCAVVVRDEVLARYPAVRAALAELSGRIPPDAMRRMNREVDLDHRPATAVAREFLNSW